MGEKCTNCVQPFSTGEAIQPDGNGGHRHPSKCGAELDGMQVKPFDWRTLYAANVCRHKSLARSCEICWRDEYLANLEAAVREVLKFDWSENDPDAVASVENMRRVVQT